MRTFSYREAAILLGGKQSKIVTALDKATGGIMLGAATAVSEVLSWFDAKADFVRLSHDLVTSAVEAKRGIRRFDRTQRIEAAHTVIVMTAFFETFAELDLPFTWAELALTPAEQEELQRASMVDADGYVGDWLRDESLLPTPDRAYSANLYAIKSRYASMGHDLYRFIRRLAIWDELDEGARDELSAHIRVLPDHAVRRYEDLFRTLVAEFPEAAFWANLIDHEATRSEVRALGASLAGLAKMLADVVVGKAPDLRREGLARAYRAQLREPVLPPGEVSHQFEIPTVERAYVNPRFRVSAILPDSKPSRESWWEDIPRRDDIQEYLAGYLTSSQATIAPLVVLGQPGAGKSMLTKVLAARLPATDYLPIRVELRDVPAELDIQDQIEHAIRQTTGDRIEWTDLARSAGDAIPVILLDGFDELLQATGAHHIDYLTKVAQFQKREADQGRELAVIVTTRIAVAGLARFPDESIALRLEPFNQAQVKQWVEIWNKENRNSFLHNGVAPLKPESVLAYPELSAQPLLLLMLAIYDADKNALQGADASITRADLYERLLTQFARREVAKANRGYTDGELKQAVEGELRRLSYVAFAMFNRGAQWVTQEELNRDLAALLGESSSGGVGLRRQLNEAEIAIGRFFFIHRARAHQAEQRVEAYEFLHATFAEYLVARLVSKLVRALMAREAAVEDFFDRPALDDSMLRALLSFAPLSSRAPVVRFLAEIMERVTETDRKAIGDVLIRIFRTVHNRQADRNRDGYEPRPASIPRRHANYSANVVIAVVAILGSIRVSELYGQEEGVIGHWQADTLLWRSQTDYYSIMNSLSWERTWNGGKRDIILRLVGPTRPELKVQLEWSYPKELAPGDKRFRSAFHTDSMLVRRQNFFASAGDDVLAHAIEPMVENFPHALTSFWETDKNRYQSVANLILRMLVMPYSESIIRRGRSYLQCAIAVAEYGESHPAWQADCANLVVARLSADVDMPALALASILQILNVDTVDPSLAIHCVLRFLGQSDASNILLLDIARRSLDRDIEPVDRIEFEIEIQLRIVELGIETSLESWGESEWRRNLRRLADSRRRPDLVRRGEWMLSHLYGPAAEG